MKEEKSPVASLEDRSHPLSWKDDSSGRPQLDGISVGRILDHAPKFFGVYCSQESCLSLLKAYCVDGLSLAESASLSGLSIPSVRKIVKNGSLRSAHDQKLVAAALSQWLEARQRWRKGTGKWTAEIMTIASSKVDSVEVYVGRQPDRATCNQLRAILGVTRATSMFRWSCRASENDADSITVCRIGSFFSEQPEDTQRAVPESGATAQRTTRRKEQNRQIRDKKYYEGLTPEQLELRRLRGKRYYEKHRERLAAEQRERKNKRRESLTPEEREIRRLKKLEQFRAIAHMGGLARARLSPQRLSEIGRMGAKASWRDMEPDRDPRLEPIPGDILMDRFGNRHIVHELGPGETRDIHVWREAMRGATVEKKGRRKGAKTPGRKPREAPISSPPNADSTAPEP